MNFQKEKRQQKRKRNQGRDFVFSLPWTPPFKNDHTGACEPLCGEPRGGARTYLVRAGHLAGPINLLAIINAVRAAALGGPPISRCITVGARDPLGPHAAPSNSLRTGRTPGRPDAPSNYPTCRRPKRLRLRRIFDCGPPRAAARTAVNERYSGIRDTGRPGVRPVRKQKRFFRTPHVTHCTSAARKRNESSVDRAVSG